MVPSQQCEGITSKNPKLGHIQYSDVMCCNVCTHAFTYIISCVFYAAKHKGSISAEHGLGFKKSQYIYHSKSKEAVSIMQDLKHLFDPKVSCTTELLIYENSILSSTYIGYSQPVQNPSLYGLNFCNYKEFMYSVYCIHAYKQ